MYASTKGMNKYYVMKVGKMQKKKSTKKNVVFLLITAMIWGVAFVAQRTGGDVIGPYMFTCTRFFLGAAVLVPVIKLLDSLKLTEGAPKTKEEKKSLWLGGLICGVVLGSFTILQQLGLYYGTPAGKAGFLTACYIVLVPVLGMFLKRKCGINVWIAVAITLVGLYLLCMNGSFAIQKSDLFVLGCSLLCAVHILVIDHFTVKVDGVRMSCIQFLFAGIVALIPTVLVDIIGNGQGFAEIGQAFQNKSLWIALLYTGIMSSGVAYTLQIVGQKDMNPTVASLLMSLESVFSVIAGWLILGERMGAKEISGCVLIFVAVVLAQIEFGAKKDK